jgi:hypothetical protein
MIQSIQSLYLSLTILLSVLFLKGSYFNFIDESKSVIKITFRGLIRDSEITGYELLEKFWPLSVIIVLIPCISLITIFLFKNRRIQLWFSLSVIVFSSGFIIFSSYCSYYICNEYNTDIIPGIKMCLPLLILILSILAYKGIKKDDDLIKSYDRLR